nr:phosphatase PAP2 family protein [Pseudomonas sp.]
PKPSVDPKEVGEVRPGSGYLTGYLTRADMPDSLALLPPPPAQGSAAFEADVQAYKTLTAMQASERGKQAAADANLKFPAAASVFSCALGIEISEAATPNLNMLLRRTLTDAGGATYRAKDEYQHTRPFALFQNASCTPDSDARLAKDGSYPSGHSALGWAWALVLTEVAPEQANAILQRGYQFGQSRAICGVHWQSDVEAGRVIGAAAVARLHSDPTFRTQLAEAKQEFEARRKVSAALPGCDAASSSAAVAKPG